MIIIVPTRGRPASIPRLLDAWDRTGAIEDGASLTVAVDRDDPELGGYLKALAERPIPVTVYVMDEWKPLVPKLNQVATGLAAEVAGLRHIGFAGDDHVPRTRGWARRYIETLDSIGQGIVYGDDGIQGKRLPTQWAMSADIVRELGAMVPGAVDHLYCDNIVRDLGHQAACLAYLPDVLIEHMHPVAGKAATDAGYERVNDPRQYAVDQRRYQAWRLLEMPEQADRIRKLRARRWPMST